VELILASSETLLKGDREAGPHACVATSALMPRLVTRFWATMDHECGSRNKYDLLNGVVHSYLWPIVFIVSTQCLKSSVLGLMLQAGSFGTVRDSFVIGLRTCNNPSVPSKKPHGC
jgi:hypothetical protein